MGEAPDPASQEFAAPDPPAPEPAPPAERLFESVDTAPLLIAIARRLTRDLAARATAEDVLQETLLHAWRDRERFEWRGPASFRRWLIAIAENRIRNLSDWEHAEKRESARTLEFSALDGSSQDGSASRAPTPAASTTPSRLAADRERAEAMQRALEELPLELREVVRLRVIEGLTMEELGRALGLHPETARYRFRRGAELYARRLAGHLPSWLTEKRENSHGDGAALFSKESNPP